MTDQRFDQGLALLCDEDGMIVRVLRDDLGIAPAMLTGRPFSALLSAGSTAKATRLFEILKDQGSVADWELTLGLAERVLTLHVSGHAQNNGIVLFGARTRATLGQLGTLFTDGAVVNAGALSMDTPADQPLDLYDELSRVNNDLANTQRTLAKQNAELTRLNEANLKLIEQERAARAELEEALRLRDEFLASISHDLKTPLTSIKGIAQMQRRRLTRAGGDHASTIDALTTIDDLTGKSTRMINEMLDLMRLRSGQPLKLEPRPVAVLELVQELIEPYRRTSPRHQFVVKHPEGLPTGRWDRDRLSRALDNVLSNAVKYSPDGGRITIEIASAAYGEAEDGWVCVQVQDQGIGIPPADLPHVFERYHRAANAQNGFAGSGIGLAGARRIIEQHGGSIAVASNEGEGTTMTVRLPTIPPPEAGA